MAKVRKRSHFSKRFKLFSWITIGRPFVARVPLSIGVYNNLMKLDKWFSTWWPFVALMLRFIGVYCNVKWNWISEKIVRQILGLMTLSKKTFHCYAVLTKCSIYPEQHISIKVLLQLTLSSPYANFFMDSLR